MVRWQEDRMVATPSWVPWSALDTRPGSTSACKISASCFKACASPPTSTSTAWKSDGASFRPAVNARPVFQATCDSINMSPTLGTVMVKVESQSYNVEEGQSYNAEEQYFLKDRVIGKTRTVHIRRKVVGG